MHEIRETRVTARRSVRMPFAAPDLSPVATLATELDKGLVGWTDFDNKVTDLTTDHLPAGFAASRLEEMTIGTVIRTPQIASTKRVAPRYATGPSDDYKARRKVSKK